MLREERRKLVKGFHLDSEFLDGSGSVFDPGVENLAHRGCDLNMVHLDRAVERVGLALVALGIGEDMGDDAALIIGGNGRVTAVAKGKFNLLRGPDLLC